MDCALPKNIAELRENYLLNDKDYQWGVLSIIFDIPRNLDEDETLFHMDIHSDVPLLEEIITNNVDAIVWLIGNKATAYIAKTGFKGLDSTPTENVQNILRDFYILICESFQEVGVDLQLTRAMASNTDPRTPVKQVSLFSCEETLRNFYDLPDNDNKIMTNFLMNGFWTAGSLAFMSVREMAAAIKFAPHLNRLSAPTVTKTSALTP